MPAKKVEESSAESGIVDPIFFYDHSTSPHSHFIKNGREQTLELFGKEKKTGQSQMKRKIVKFGMLKFWN